MNKGDIYLTRFPFGGTVGAKARPALLLTGLVGPVPEVLCAYISAAVMPSPLLPTDLVIDPGLPENAPANLKAVSIVRLHKLATVHQRDAYRKIGTLPSQTVLEVDLRLRALLGL